MNLISRPNLRALAFSGLLFALGTDRALAQTAESYPFTLQGTLTVGTCDLLGNDVMRDITGVGIYATGLASTCNTPIGLSDSTCAARAGDQGAAAALAQTGPIGLYTVDLQRLMFTLDPATLIGPINYRLLGTNVSSGPFVRFQGSRYVRYYTPSINFTAPWSDPALVADPLDPLDPGDPSHVYDDQVVQIDFVNERMASLRLSFTFAPTRLDDNGNLAVTYDGTESISVSSNTTPIELTTTNSHPYVDGDIVEITGLTSSPGANGVWVVDALTATTFRLVGSTGGGGGVESGTSRRRVEATERIARVVVSAYGGQANPPATPYSSHSVFDTSSRVLDVGQDPALVNGYLTTRARVAGEQQVVTMELPLTPNAGVFASPYYGVVATFTFDDNTVVSVPVPSSALTELAPCAQVTLPTLTLTKPSTTLVGSIVLKPAAGYATSPYVTAYAPLLGWISGPGHTNNRFIRTNSSGPVFVTTPSAAGQATTPLTAADPYVFTWTGFPEGVYRVDLNYSTTGIILHPYGHARLSYPDRPPFRYLSSDSPNAVVADAIYGFPPGGFATSSPNPVDPATGQFTVAVDEPLALTIAGDMAYVDGDLNLLCSVTNASVSSGAAEVLGQSRPPALGVDEIRYFEGGIARGLFMAGSSDWLIAATAGSWVERKYRIKIDEVGYDGMILIEPANPSTYTLVAGATPVAGTSRSYTTGRLTLRIRTDSASDNFNEPCAGPEVGCVKKPRLEIGEDYGLSTNSSAQLAGFYDPADPTSLLGGYYSVSNELDDNWVRNPIVGIYGVSSSLPVTVRPSAVKLSNGVEVRAAWNDVQQLIPPCADICIDRVENPDGSFTEVTYFDDGAGPVISGTTPSQTLPMGQTSVTLSGTLNDQVPISEVFINGTACSDLPGCTLTAGSGLGGVFTATFSVAVTGLTEGTHSFTISARGYCLNDTEVPAQVVITVPVDVCVDPGFDMCMESNPGSIFYVDVVRTSDDAVCQLRCEIAAPGAALTCDAAPVCPN